MVEHFIKEIEEIKEQQKGWIKRQRKKQENKSKQEIIFPFLWRVSCLLKCSFNSVPLLAKFYCRLFTLSVIIGTSSTNLNMMITNNVWWTNITLQSIVDTLDSFTCGSTVIKLNECFQSLVLITMWPCWRFIDIKIRWISSESNE